VSATQRVSIAVLKKLPSKTKLRGMDGIEGDRDARALAKVRVRSSVWKDWRVELVECEVAVSLRVWRDVVWWRRVIRVETGVVC
jgi:hypothetical protein